MEILKLSEFININRGKKTGFMVNSGKMDTNIPTVLEAPPRKKKFKRRKKRSPKRPWIPTGKPNYIRIERKPYGI